jgi:hypothetical protein
MKQAVKTANLHWLISFAILSNLFFLPQYSLNLDHCGNSLDQISLNSFLPEVVDNLSRKSSQIEPSLETRIKESYGKLPMNFELARLNTLESKFHGVFSYR